MKSKIKDIKHSSPEPDKLAVYDMQGEKKSELPSVFNAKPNYRVLSQAVLMYLANLRSGLAATKTRGEVSGGGKKPWRQKGTGRARAGSIRSPLWRHGGVVFGPHPRNFHYSLSANVRNLALLAALNEKNIKGNILVLDTLAITEAKSREMRKLLDNLKVKDKALIILDRPQKNIHAASKNIPGLALGLVKNINALDIARAGKIIFLKDALEAMDKRLSILGARSLNK